MDPANLFRLLYPDHLCLRVAQLFHPLENNLGYGSTKILNQNTEHLQQYIYRADLGNLGHPCHQTLRDHLSSLGTHQDQAVQRIHYHLVGLKCLLDRLDLDGLLDRAVREDPFHLLYLDLPLDPLGLQKFKLSKTPNDYFSVFKAYWSTRKAACSGHT
jgi:hypothetical protein